MKKVLVLFILVFCQAEAIVMLPQGCLDQRQACAIRTQEGVFKSSHVGPSNFALFENSSVFRDATGYVFLLNGSLRAKSKKSEQIRTVFTDIIYTGEIYLKGDADKVVIRNVSGEVKLQLRDHQDLTLPEGMEVWVAGLDRKKKTTYGVIKKIDLLDHIKLWSRIYDGSKSEFAGEVKEFKKRWQSVQEQEINFYREVASEAQEKQEKSELDSIAKAKRDQLRRQKEKAQFIERSFSR